MKATFSGTLLGTVSVGLLSLNALAADRVTFTGAEHYFPESITSTADGTLYISSAARTVFRALPGADSAEPWIETGPDAPRSTFGVLAHQPSKTLFVCTGTVGEFTGTPPVSRLYQYDLATGALKSSHPLANTKSICNDIAVAREGGIYVTDTGNAQILKLRGDRLEVWSPAGPFGDRQSVLDGIAVLGDRVLVNTLRTNRLVVVDIRPDGSAGAPRDIALDRPLAAPDGMRAVGDDTLIVGENRQPGRVVLVKLQGDRGVVTELATNLAHGSVAVTAVGSDVWFVAPHAFDAGPPKRFKAERIGASPAR